MLAAQGDLEAAEKAFEESLEVSHRCGLRLYKMLALRDLQQCVLHKLPGRAQEVTPRLKALLQEMVGPPAELTKLLGDGFDAAEILSS